MRTLYFLILLAAAATMVAACSKIKDNIPGPNNTLIPTKPGKIYGMLANTHGDTLKYYRLTKLVNADSTDSSATWQAYSNTYYKGKLFNSQLEAFISPGVLADTDTVFSTWPFTQIHLSARYTNDTIRDSGTALAPAQWRYILDTTNHTRTRYFYLAIPKLTFASNPADTFSGFIRQVK